MSPEVWLFRFWWRRLDVDAFLISFFFVLVAEMGDKTQLVALAFAARYPARTVLAGVFWATLVVHLVSVAIGEVVGAALPTFWINLLAGAAFVGFGLWTLRGDDLEEGETSRLRRVGPLLTVAADIFGILAPEHRAQRDPASLRRPAPGHGGDCRRRNGFPALAAVGPGSTLAHAQHPGQQQHALTGPCAEVPVGPCRVSEVRFQFLVDVSQAAGDGPGPAVH